MNFFTINGRVFCIILVQHRHHFTLKLLLTDRFQQILIYLYLISIYQVLYIIRNKNNMTIYLSYPILPTSDHIHPANIFIDDL